MKHPFTPARIFAALLCMALPLASGQQLSTQGKCYEGKGSNTGKVAAFGEVKNNQGFAVRARGSIHIYDTSGKLIYERLGAISSIDLLPGETAPVYDVSTKGNYGKIGRCDLDFTYEEAGKFAYLERGLVSGLVLQGSAGSPLTIKGKLKNPLGKAARYKLYVTGYNASGEVVMMAFQVSPGGKMLSGGSSTSFEVTTYDYIEKPVRLKALAVLQ
ncbi:hypothetical protein [Deinococcus roseus]|uniref:Uncharacterized protein n=1 Tax=Deinococcus roseus TaxID=392414 RepID=A0ABQ2D4Z3_9DEIO|nr:hypothetical protein [Deinococcus roseus]GGJ42996.1 hypothetical protein GCM10008938_31470 [Deinococcus roseus]